MADMPQLVHFHSPHGGTFTVRMAGSWSACTSTCANRQSKRTSARAPEVPSYCSIAQHWDARLACSTRLCAKYSTKSKCPAPWGGASHASEGGAAAEQSSGTRQSSRSVMRPMCAKSSRPGLSAGPAWSGLCRRHARSSEKAAPLAICAMHYDKKAPALSMRTLENSLALLQQGYNLGSGDQISPTTIMQALQSTCHYQHQSQWHTLTATGEA